MNLHPGWLGAALLGSAVLLASGENGRAEDGLTERKIRLMAAALRARDEGDLATARQKAEELRRLVPRDASVEQMLRDLDRRASAADAAAAREGREAPDRGRPDRDGATMPATEENPAQLVAVETARVERVLAQVPRVLAESRLLAEQGRREEAETRIAALVAELPVNPLTKPALAAIEEARQTWPRDNDAAWLPLPDASVETFAKARSQYLAGELDAAAATFRDLPANAPERAEAERFLVRIARERTADAASQRERTRDRLLADVAESWRPPVAPAGQPLETVPEPETSALARKLDAIVLPHVSFTRVEIGQVVAALSAISEEFDRTGEPTKGVNVVLLDPTEKAPKVTLTLRDTTLRRVLDLATEAIGYHYEIQADVIIVRPGGEAAAVETAFFPVTRATVARMRDATGAGAKTPAPNPFSSAGATNEPALTGGEGAAVKAFLQQAGVKFDEVAGASLAYDGSTLIVTQTARNLRRVRNILARYREVRQVEIEAKFMEVQQGVLEELGVNWTVGQKATQHSGAKATYQTNGRTLLGAFGSTSGNQQGRIVRPESTTETAGGGVTATTPLDLPILNPAPRMPGSPELGASSNPLATISGIIGEFDVNAVVRALSQQQGTDLLSAPKVTVLSGNPATITVAQEMRYPQSFGQTQSQVGTGSASGGGSAGVAITAGTPQEFTARNIGVELKVTPTVEEDDYSISLDLNPKVTEFDGFVEYGGPSIAISGSTTVTVPSGFYQPIFSVRDISTKVTIWDGATLVMGGLTREEVKKVNDKVPILGDIPFLGRAFRSKGESAQKRNLLIFVTANLVSPGGALRPGGSRSAAVEQRPAKRTPAATAGAVAREP